MLLLLVAAAYGLAIAWAGVGVLGVRLFWIGTVGRRDGTHPHCRACGRDLFGTPSSICPECGRVIEGAGSIVRGTRRPDDRQAAIGAAVIALLALVLAAIMIVPAQPPPFAARSSLSVSTGSNAGADAPPSSSAAREG